MVDPTSNERLRSVLRNADCPHWSGPMASSDDGKVGYCVDGGHCTCEFGPALREAGTTHETGGSHSERYRVALQKIIDDGDYTAPEGMKLIAREALANGTCESRAALDVLAERLRQVSIEGWTQGHDDSHTRGTLAKAAAAYVWSAIYELSDGFIGPRADVYHASRHWGWPWNADWWKPKGPRRDLVRAGALIIAEIERLDRSSSEKAEVCGRCRGSGRVPSPGGVEGEYCACGRCGGSGHAKSEGEDRG